MNVSNCKLISLELIWSNCKEIKFLNASNNYLKSLISANLDPSAKSETTSSIGSGQVVSVTKMAKNSTKFQSHTQTYKRNASRSSASQKNQMLPSTLEELLISNNYLTSLFSLKFTSSSHLQILDISDNQIRSILKLAEQLYEHRSQSIEIQKICSPKCSKQAFEIKYLCIEGNPL